MKINFSNTSLTPEALQKKQHPHILLAALLLYDYGWREVEKLIFSLFDEGDRLRECLIEENKRKKEKKDEVSGTEEVSL